MQRFDKTIKCQIRIESWKGGEIEKTNRKLAVGPIDHEFRNRKETKKATQNDWLDNQVVVSMAICVW